MNTAVALAAELYRFFETEGIRYAVVGDVSEFPARIRSDLDIVVEPSALPGMYRRLRGFFEQREARLVQVLQHEQTAWFYVFAWENEQGKIDFIHPDICGDYYRDGRRLLTAEEVLADRVLPRGRDGIELQFYVPRPSMAFIYYLLKRIDKADLSGDRGAYLTAVWRQDPEGSERQVRRFWSGDDATQIIKAADSGDWSHLQLPRLRNKLHSKVGWQPSWGMGELVRIQRRLRQPTGVWVAFLGPDGSGKSTVIRRVREDLGPAFRRTRVVHLRPSLGRRGSPGGPVTEPHADPPRAWPGSLAKLGYWLFDYTVGYLVQTRPAITRSTLLLYDRYYPDILADPVRYRFKGSARLARGLMELIPHPDMYVFLDVPARETHRRKGELPVQEIERQREAYRALAQALPNAHLIDASDAPEAVARTIESLILDHMESREAGRHSGSKPLSSYGL